MESSTPVSTEQLEATAHGIAAMFRVGLGMLSLLIHRWRTPGDNAVWLFNGDEDPYLVGISEPLGRIVARRVPLGNGVASDLSDGIEAGAATLAYTVGNLSDEQQLKALPVNPIVPDQ